MNETQKQEIRDRIAALVKIGLTKDEALTIVSIEQSKVILETLAAEMKTTALTMSSS